MDTHNITNFFVIVKISRYTISLCMCSSKYVCDRAYSGLSLDPQLNEQRLCHLFGLKLKSNTDKIRKELGRLSYLSHIFELWNFILQF